MSIKQNLNISCSIVTFSDGFVPRKINDLENALISFRKCLNSGKIIIVDNSKIPYFKSPTEKIDNCEYIHDPSNPGFGRSHNKAIRSLNESKYHLILNPDVLIKDKEILIKLYTQLIKLNASLVQPRILGFDNKEQFLCKKDPTLLAMIIRMYKLHLRFRFFEKYNNKYIMLEKAYNKKRNTRSSYLSGCAMMVNLIDFRRVSGFDKRFFMYLEDADLSRSLNQINGAYQIGSCFIFHRWAKENHTKLRLKFISIVSFIKYSFKWGLKII